MLETQIFKVEYSNTTHYLRDRFQAAKLLQNNSSPKNIIDSHSIGPPQPEPVYEYPVAMLISIRRHCQDVWLSDVS